MQARCQKQHVDAMLGKKENADATQETKCGHNNGESNNTQTPWNTMPTSAIIAKRPLAVNTKRVMVMMMLDDDENRILDASCSELSKTPY